MKKNDVLLLGEVLVDFVPEEDSIPGRFRASAGGAPGNVACGLGKLGVNTALLARVGKDALGECIIRTLEKNGVDTEYIQIDEERFTTVTIVMPESEDMLRYAIYRSDSADGALEYNEIPKELFRHSKILHYGSLAAATEKSKKAMEQAIIWAKKNGVTTSIDVNLRPNSWKSQEDMIRESLRLIDESNIVKMTKDEAQVLGIEPEKMASKQKKIVVVTDGENEAVIYAGDIKVCQKPGKVQPVDVTGGGDSFMAAFLYYYVKYKESMDAEEFYREALNFAICASSITIQRYGAIESLPTLDEIEKKRKQA